MPYEVASPLDAGLSAAGSFVAGIEARRKTQIDEERQKRQDQYQQALAQQSAARLQLEAQKGARDQTTWNNEQADRATTLKTTADVNSQNANLKYPPNWDKLPIPIQIRYLRNREQMELAKQNTEGVRTTQAQIAGLQTEYNRQQTAEQEAKRQAAALAATALNRDAANTRSANEIGAANTRSANTIGADSARQTAGFSHADTAAANAHAFTRSEDDRRWKHEDASAAAKTAATAKKTGPKLNPQYVAELNTLKTNPRILALPLSQLDALSAGVLTYGGAQTLAHLKDAAAGKLVIPGISASDAANIVQVYGAP